MIQDSIRGGRYPIKENQKDFANIIEIKNRSNSDEIEQDREQIQIETRIGEIYVINNYLPGTQHLPGVIELDVLDSFNMLCRRAERANSGTSVTKIKKNKFLN